MRLTIISLSAILFCGFISCTASRISTDLYQQQWVHGTENCKEDTSPPIQVVRINNNTWMLRENKCVHYEAPFMFLFLGDKKALLMDTGATEDEGRFPLAYTVMKILTEWRKRVDYQVELVVAHTHSHGDHVTGDVQFKNRPNVSIVGLKVDDIKSFFTIADWPVAEGFFNLGNRSLEIIPIPGHHKTSIAVYDAETRILLSGDTFYPGRLYVDDWQSFKSSIQRLVDFTRKHKTIYILGNHIEMTDSPGVDYPVGTTYQPHEHALPLKVKDLKRLNAVLTRLGDTPKREVLKDFIIYPK
ncbi:MAG: MBL fold metallo-hydrolase [Bacteroidota bacterium]|nr:MBL fold metallo-hydrolase [Bacteroidota bacterium]